MKNEPHRKTTAIKDKKILSNDILIVDDEIPNLKLFTQNLSHPLRSKDRPTKTKICPLIHLRENHRP